MWEPDFKHEKFDIFYGSSGSWCWGLSSYSPSRPCCLLKSKWKSNWNYMNFKTTWKRKYHLVFFSSEIVNTFIGESLLMDLLGHIEMKTSWNSNYIKIKILFRNIYRTKSTSLKTFIKLKETELILNVLLIT